MRGKKAKAIRKMAQYFLTERGHIEEAVSPKTYRDEEMPPKMRSVLARTPDGSPVYDDNGEPVYNDVPYVPIQRRLTSRVHIMVKTMKKNAKNAEIA